MALPNRRLTLSPLAMTISVFDEYQWLIFVEEDTTGGGVYVPSTSVHVSLTITDAGGASSIFDVANSTADNPGPNTDENGISVVTFYADPTAGAGTCTLHASTPNVPGGSGAFVFTGSPGTAGSSADAVATVDPTLQAEPGQIYRRL